MMQVLAHTALHHLKGVGGAVGEKLARLGITTVQDLLFHLPRDYEDRSYITPIAGLAVGRSALLEGTVLAAEVLQGKRTSFVVRFTDGSGTLTLRFYHFYAQQKQHFQPGKRLRVFGEARLGASGLEIYHPDYQSVQPGDPLPESRLTPLYPATDGLTQARLRQLMEQALKLLTPQSLPELLPDQFSLRYSLIDALRFVHHPPADCPREQLLAGLHPAQQRLAFEELTAHQVSLAQRRRLVRSQQAPPLPVERRWRGNS